MSTYLPIAFVILGYLAYHSSQKLVPGSVHPFASLIVTYAVALAICTILFFTSSQRPPLGHALRELNWTSYMVGLAVVALEGGFLLAYRAGWNVSMTGLMTNVSAAILLLPLGVFFFRESLSSWNVVGIILAVTGIVLMKLPR